MEEEKKELFHCECYTESESEKHCVGVRSAGADSIKMESLIMTFSIIKSILDWSQMSRRKLKDYGENEFSVSRKKEKKIFIHFSSDVCSHTSGAYELREV